MKNILIYIFLFCSILINAQSNSGIRIDRLEPSKQPKKIIMSSPTPDGNGNYLPGYYSTTQAGIGGGDVYNITTLGDTLLYPDAPCNSVVRVDNGDTCLSFAMVRNCAIPRWDTLIYALKRNCADGGGSSGIFTVQNGLNQSGSIGELGGNLLHNTQINGKDLYNLEVRDAKRFAVVNNTGKYAYTFSLANDAAGLNFLSITDTTTGQQNALFSSPTYGHILSAAKSSFSCALHITPKSAYLTADSSLTLNAKQELSIRTPMVNNNPTALKNGFYLSLIDSITGKSEWMPIPNSVINNILNSSSNIITSNVNGSIDTTLIIRSLAMSIAGNILTVTVNGVSQTVALPVGGSGGITTNMINSNGNIITSTVNGISDTTLAVRNVTNSIVGSQLTTSVNGVVSSPITLPSGDNWGIQVVQKNPTLEGQGTTTNPLKIAQQGATTGQTLKWNGTTWFPANDIDNDAQTLSIAGNVLTISNGNSVTIPSSGGGGGGDNWGTQVVQKDATLAGTGVPGNLLKIAQQGATNGQTLKWNGTTWLPANDNDAQTLSIAGNILSILNGNSVTLPSAAASPDITVTDSPSIDLTATGTGNHNITASAKISATAGNQLQSLADGLYVTGSGGGGGGSVTASNGLSMIGTDVRLGGTLSNTSTIIDGLNSKNLYWKDIQDWKIQNSIGTTTFTDQISVSGLNRQIINNSTNLTGWTYVTPTLVQGAVGIKTGPSSYAATNFFNLDETGSTNGVRIGSTNKDVRIEAVAGKIVSEASAGQNHLMGKTGIFLKTPQVYNAPGSLASGYVFSLINPTTGQGEWQPAPSAPTYTGGTGISVVGTLISNTGDLSNTNELQTISKGGNTVTLSNGGGSFTDSDAQTLSLAGNTLTILNGNSITLPTSPDITVTDSPTIDLTASGANNHSITAAAKISATAGNIISQNADGLYATATGGSTYTSNNGLTTTGTNHQLGGNLVQNTTIAGVNSFGLSLDNLTNYRFRNLTAGNTVKYWLNMDYSIPTSNFWQVTHGTTSNYAKLSMNPSTEASLGYFTNAGGYSRIINHGIGLDIESTLGNARIESINNKLQLQGKTGVEIKTPKVYAGTATVGQVFTITNATTGEGEWQTPSGGGSSYTSDNGLTTTGTNHQLGGTLLHHTTINQNGFDMTFNGNYPRKSLSNFYIDSVFIYSVTAPVAGSPNNYAYDEVSTNGSVQTVRQVKTTSPINSDVQHVMTNTGHNITASNQATLKTSVLTVSDAGSNEQVRMASYGSAGATSGCDLAVTPSAFWQRNMPFGFIGQNVVNTTTNNGDGSDKRLAQGTVIAGLGAVSYTNQSVVNTAITNALVMHTNAVPATNNLPSAASSLNKVLEIRAFGTATVTLNPSPLLNTSGASITTLQPIGSNSYGSPTYVKIMSDGTNWNVISMY